MNDNVEIRNYRPEYLPALVALYNEANEHDRLERMTTLEEMEHEMAESNYYPETDCFLAWRNRRLVGYADLYFRKGEEENIVFTEGMVHPEWRRRGLGARLMKTVWQRAAERMGEAERGPVYLQGGGFDVESDRRALFEHFGMSPIRTYVNMARPLNGNLPPVVVPEGYRLRPFDLARDVEPMWRVISTAFRDHWGNHTRPLEDFKRDRIGMPDFRPELLLMAENEAGEPVGCCFNAIHPDKIAQTGRKEGYVGTLAVLREARHHGLGAAMLAETMRIFRAEGMEGIHLHADAENLTGAVRLYERMGFRVRKHFIAYRAVMRDG